VPVARVAGNLEAAVGKPECGVNMIGCTLRCGCLKVRDRSAVVFGAIQMLRVQGRVAFREPLGGLDV
jgi:hypothetical protein